MESTENTQERTETTSSTEQVESLNQTEQKTPFNPFAALMPEEIAALAGRFNNTYRAQNQAQISEVVALWECSVVEACFYVWLRQDARAILTRERIKDAVDSILRVIDEVSGKNGKIALEKIKAEYESLDVFQRPTCGKKVREAAAKTFTIKIAKMLLDEVYNYLGVKESEWM